MKTGCTPLGNTIICNFASTDDLKGKNLTYENVKSLVLDEGRFSVFEATATPKHCRIFTDLGHDPELETYEMEFPWTGLRRKDPVLVDCALPISRMHGFSTKYGWMWVYQADWTPTGKRVSVYGSTRTEAAGLFLEELMKRGWLR